MKARSPFQINRAVIFALVLREAAQRMGARRLGLCWVVLEPLAHLAIISLMFAYIRGGHLPGIEYPVFILTGLAPFLLFRNTALRLMDSLKANRSLFAYKQIKPLDTFIARTLVEACIASAVYLVLIFIFGWFGFDVSIAHPIEWLGTLALGLLFSFALGVTLALIVHPLPGAKLFIRMLFFPLYFLSAVLHPASFLPQSLLPLLLLNPYLHLMELIRAEVFPYYQMVDGISAQFVMEVTIVLLFISLGVYRARRFHLISTKNGG